MESSLSPAQAESRQSSISRGRLRTALGAPRARGGGRLPFPEVGVHMTRRRRQTTPEAVGANSRWSSASRDTRVIEPLVAARIPPDRRAPPFRSEERRVGKEGRSRG